ERIDVVNLRMMGDGTGPVEGSLADRFAALAELREQGLIGELGVSNVTVKQLEQAQQIAPVVCVQNHFNITKPDDADLLEHCAEQGIAYVPFFPLGGAFDPVSGPRLRAVAARHGVAQTQVALAALLARSPNLLLIPGTSSVAHLEQNLAAAKIELTTDDLAELAG
ncbi:MAG: aldo/keto reductase, partial [Sciscionella sp.]